MGHLKGAVILGSLFLSLGFFTQAVTAKTPDTVIARFEGEVEIKQGQTVAWQKAEKGRVIHPGDIIRTGAKSWAMIRHNSAKIQLFENTLLEFPKEQSSQRVSQSGNDLVTVVLQKGHSIFKVFKNRLKRRFEVISPSLIAGVKGTVFEVFEKESFKGVAVSEGVVEVINLDFRGEILELTANQIAEIRDDHLMPPREHLGEDLLHEEQHSQEKPNEADPLQSEVNTELHNQEKDDAKEHEEDIKSDSKEHKLSLRNAEKALAADLREERKTLLTDLKDERRTLAADLRNEGKEMTADFRADLEVGPPDHSNAGGNPPSHSNAGGNPPDHSNAGGNGRRQR